MALQYGLIIINGKEGFYYTPPDNITRCLVPSSNVPNKYELQTLLANNINGVVTYRELVSSSINFKLDLFRYETDNIPINIKEHCLANERAYVNKFTNKFTNELHKKSTNKEWLNFFQRTSILELMSS